MIDHLIRFNSEAEAIADPVVGQYSSEEGRWRGDCCFPGQMVWKTEDNTTDEDGNAITHPLPYWHITISLPQVSTELRNHSSCMIVWDVDRDEPVMSVIPVLTDYRMSPMPSGRNYLNGTI